MTAGTDAVVLAFDTSTEALAVALQSPAGAFTAEEAGGAAASARLLPCIEGLLARAGVVHRQLDAIAFGRGPGAFTGLRTSCAVAQGLAFGLDVPVLPLDSLLIVAEDARAQAAAGTVVWSVTVAMDARMGEIYAGRYAWREGRWAVLTAPALYALPDFNAGPGATASDAIAGSALQSFGDRLETAPRALAVPRERARAAALLRLASAAWRDGAAVDAGQALPLYLRDKIALTTAERDAVRAAKAGLNASAAPAQGSVR